MCQPAKPQLDAFTPQFTSGARLHLVSRVWAGESSTVSKFHVSGLPLTFPPSALPLPPPTQSGYPNPPPAPPPY